MARKPNPQPGGRAALDAALRAPSGRSLAEILSQERRLGTRRFEPKLLGDLLDQAVAAYGARPCTYFMGKRLSFAEIGALSDRAAKGLRDDGVGEGVKVGLLLPNTPDLRDLLLRRAEGRRHRRQFQSTLQP